MHYYFISTLFSPGHPLVHPTNTDILPHIISYDIFLEINDIHICFQHISKMSIIYPTNSKESDLLQRKNDHLLVEYDINPMTCQLMTCFAFNFFKVSTSCTWVIQSWMSATFLTLTELKNKNQLILSLPGTIRNTTIIGAVNTVRRPFLLPLHTHWMISILVNVKFCLCQSCP